jgi:PiT family inorganic phosphate transporter
VSSNDTLLALVVVTALGFDFTNGFHDTGNAMATSIATGALPPRIAVALSGVLNLVGAFLSFTVAATIASGLVQSHLVTPTVVFAGLVGGILWNLATWYLGIPSSSSHALIGGVIGATLAAAGGHAVLWHGVISKVVLPAVLSPVVAGGVAALGTWTVYRLTRSVPEGTRSRGFRIGQIGSASMVSLAHGTNDAQKTMGVITLALIANGSLHSGAKAPAWVIVSCALAISLGTYIGGWRVIRALGKGLVEIEAPQGMAAESASAATILVSSSFGWRVIRALGKGLVEIEAPHRAWPPSPRRPRPSWSRAASATRSRPRTWPPVPSSVRAWASGTPRCAGAWPGAWPPPGC